MNTELHFSSRTDLWSTPQALFDRLDAEFGFTMDVCAVPENAKCLSFYTRRDDGLAQPWSGVVWCNPPYGRGISRWVVKACHCSWRGEATVVCLLPAKTETAWWHDYVLKAHEIRFIRTRLRFGGCNVNAPFPSAIVVFKPYQRRTESPLVRWWTPTPAERGAA